MGSLAMVEALCLLSLEEEGIVDAGRQERASVCAPIPSLL